ncbi:hypothetical protein OG849_10045 [Streptomyces cyaneofuscatus]|uniref:Uncharacterized protein n=1 Tax=Streptomyces cyaneofuscatus TaxID=66883 RepID=A0ABZ1ETW5_9ACTN|nr:hypothetical protein [Streptomyces cyaneofuscatus]WSB07568.1 hypothetical protein OG849_10045 [Streptomyces cyaneofuscatus]WSD48899.1 hypothetical protein OG857_25355 [Streptomyces cyaneofuscatus]WTA92316.1 hypothetical protein OG323_26570 [Streptomyces cyaneofuscatus]
MLQCTAVTEVPLSDALTALVTMDGGPDDPSSALAPTPYVLCELGEHDARTEHAALLSPAEVPHRPALWFFWTGDGTDRVHRVVNVPWCPAVLRTFATDSVLQCAFFDRHTAPHSWGVTDPLGDLIAGPATSGDVANDPKERPQP